MWMGICAPSDGQARRRRRRARRRGRGSGISQNHWPVDCDGGHRRGRYRTSVSVDDSGILPAMLSREIRGAVAWLTLDRPDKLNAMPRSFYDELAHDAAEIEADDAVRVVVVHGAGRCFSVGGDIEDFGNIAAGSPSAAPTCARRSAGFRACGRAAASR